MTPRLLAAATAAALLLGLAPGALAQDPNNALPDGPGKAELIGACTVCHDATTISGQARTPEQISHIVVKTTPAGLPVRIGDIANVMPSVMPVYTIVTANGKPAVLLNLFRHASPR